MKILWIINIPLIEASRLMSKEHNYVGGSWLESASQCLADGNICSLVVGFPQKDLKKFEVFYGEKIKYYAFPKVKNNVLSSSYYDSNLRLMLDEIKPDLVHIFGTEFEHTLSVVEECEHQKICSVISIQGLVSVISAHYTSGLPPIVQNRYTFRDLLKNDNIRRQQHKFHKKGLLEIAAIGKTKHIIGRTTWDKACSQQINPMSTYHYCNETLRDQFYNHKWTIDRCERNTVFISQASYPIKGLHYVLEALRIVLKSYPDTKLYIAGDNLLESNRLVYKLKMSSYLKYIRDSIKKYGLKENVFFVGKLDEENMCKRYLQSHVFVSASTIENESNSLSEAKILGVPVIASYVGGVIDRVKHGVDGFHYQHDAPYMLAYYICEIFRNDSLANDLSRNARRKALEINDKEENTRRLIEIYEQILASDK